MASIESRKVPGGGTIYRVNVRRKGYPVQSASFRRLTDARKWAQSIEAAIHEGRHFKGSDRSGKTDRPYPDLLRGRSTGGTFSRHWCFPLALKV